MSSIRACPLLLFCWICYFGGARATAWQRTGPEDVSPAAQPSPSLLIGGTRAPFFRTTRLPSADELFVGVFSVTRDIDLPIAQFLDVVGIGRHAYCLFSGSPALSAFAGNQRRTRPLVVGILAEQMPADTASLRFTATLW